MWFAAKQSINQKKCDDEKIYDCFGCRYGKPWM